MTQPRAAVICPVTEAEAAFVALGRGEAATVLYLGASFTELTRLQRALPAGWTLLPTGQMVNAAARRLRPLLINLDAAVLPPDAARIWWDATHLGERNPLASTLALNLARLDVMHDTLAQAPRCLVLTDDAALSRLFYGAASRAGHAIGWGAPGRSMPLGERLRDGVAVVRVLAHAVYIRLRGVAAFARHQRILRQLRRRHPMPLAALRGSNLLTVSWARVETFPAGATLPADVYLPGFAALARDFGWRVGYLVRALPGLDDFRAMVVAALSCPTPVVVIEELVPLRTVVGAAFSTLLLPWRLRRAAVQGSDLRTVLRFEALRELGSWDAVFALTHRTAIRNLAGLGIAPGVVLHPYENQPWEKMLHLELRKDFPSSRIVAVQHSPFAFDYLSLFPSHREIAFGLIPDWLLVPGDGFAEWFRDVGFPADRLAVIGAPRYQSAFFAQTAGGEAILCCTGIDLAESIELAAMAALASRGLNRQLLINYHPVTNESFRRALRDSVTHFAPGDQSHLRFVDAPVGKLLADARVVLYSTSAAAFDAMLAGKRAIYVRRAAVLDYDKMPEEFSSRCGSVEELRQAIRAAFDGAGNDGAAALARWLAPVQPAIFSQILQGNRSQKELIA